MIPSPDRMPAHPLRRVPGWLPPAAVGAGAAIVCLGLAVVDTDTRAAFSPACPIRAVTGLDCPGCGATRALHALTRGDPALAMDHNLLLAVVLPVTLWAWWRWLAVGAGWRDRGPLLPVRAAWRLLAVAGAFTVLRNVPVWPLSWLGSGAA